MSHHRHRLPEDRRGRPGSRETGSGDGARSTQTHPTHRARLPPRRAPASRVFSWLALLSLLGILLAKLKALILGPIFFKSLVVALKIGKFGATALSMVVTIAAYAWAYGLPFAAGLVLLLFLHEMGHGLVLRQHGIPSRGPIFVPFLGAFLTMRDLPGHPLLESHVALAGPMAGTTASFICLVLYWLYVSPFWLALAYTGFLINSINLLPIRPLDGGRIAHCLSRRLWVVGGACLILLVFLRPGPVPVLMLVLAGWHLWKDLRVPVAEQVGGDEVPADLRRQLAAIYFGLAVLLGFAAMTTFQQLQDLPGYYGLQ